MRNTLRNAVDFVSRCSAAFKLGLRNTDGERVDGTLLLVEAVNDPLCLLEDDDIENIVLEEFIQDDDEYDDRSCVEEWDLDDLDRVQRVLHCTIASMQWRAHISNARSEKHISHAILHPQISRRNVHLTFRVEINIVQLTAKIVRVIRDFVHISTRIVPAEHALSSNRALYPQKA
jgi:hypothetical protein